VWATQRFAGKPGRAQHVSDRPRTVRDLDFAVREIGGVLTALRAVADAWVAEEGRTAAGDAAPQARQAPMSPSDQAIPSAPSADTVRRARAPGRPRRGGARQ
jgi:hypothetical protein